MFDKFAQEDDLAIAEAVSRTLSDALPEDRLSQGDGGMAAEQAFWPQLVDLGYLGVNLPETVGGAAAGELAELAMFRVFGQRLLSPRALAQVVAGALAHWAGEPALAQKILDGTQSVACAHDGHLVDGAQAGLVLEITPDGLRLTEIAAHGPQQGWSIDDALPVGGFTAGAILAQCPANAAPHMRAIRLTAAMLVGNAEATTALAIAHAKERKQFDTPIGAFQAVKHMCADMSVRANTAGAQLAHCLTPEDGVADVTETYAAALLAGESAKINAATAIQIFGGMGFTAECPVQRYLKRAVILELLAGGRQIFAQGTLADALPEIRA